MGLISRTSGSKWCSLCSGFINSWKKVSQRNVVTHRIKMSGIPAFNKFLIRMEWSILSNAFLKSRKTIHTALPSSSRPTSHIWTSSIYVQVTQVPGLLSIQLMIQTVLGLSYPWWSPSFSLSCETLGEVSHRLTSKLVVYNNLWYWHFHRLQMGLAKKSERSRSSQLSKVSDPMAFLTLDQTS